MGEQDGRTAKEQRREASFAKGKAAASRRTPRVRIYLPSERSFIGIGSNTMPMYKTVPSQ